MKPRRRIRRTPYGYIAACGKRGDEWYSLSEHHHGACYELAFDRFKSDRAASRALRLLKRITRDIAEPLAWTSEPPTVDGWYWVREKGFLSTIPILWVHSCAKYKNSKHDWVDHEENLERFGPIEVPE